MVAVAIPKIGDHGAVTAGHEPRLATRARATPAGALAWVAYVRVVIAFCAFTFGCSRWKFLARVSDHATGIGVN